MTRKPEQLAEGITLYEGDCLDVLPTLAAGSVDCIVADPPYGISQRGVTHVRQAGMGSRRFDFFAGDDDWRAMRETVAAALGLTFPLMAANGSAYWWCGHRHFGRITDAYEDAGWGTRFLAWAKSAPPPPPPGSGWPSGAELCVYAYRPGRTWNHKGTNPPPNNVIQADSFRHGQPGKVAHPTQKPLAVYRPIFAASTRIGDTILDPFAGSGTVGVLAVLTGRRCVLIERDPKYCDVIRRRIEKADGREKGTLTAMHADGLFEEAGAA